MHHSSILADSAVRTILAERIDVQHQGVGIAVGLIGPEGKQVVVHGQMAINDARPVDGDTIFEIGSITKVFTALLLTAMVERGLKPRMLCG
jgi:serine-type D-Ala-D-Ala carboxypeptidase/endopeptidase